MKQLHEVRKLQKIAGLLKEDYDSEKFAKAVRDELLDQYNEGKISKDVLQKAIEELNSSEEAYGGWNESGDLEAGVWRAIRVILKNVGEDEEYQEQTPAEEEFLDAVFELVNDVVLFGDIDDMFKDIELEEWELDDMIEYMDRNPEKILQFMADRTSDEFSNEEVRKAAVHVVRRVKRKIRK